MPELPEVEVIRLFLEDKLLGLSIKSLKILNQKSFIGDPKRILNRKIIKFSRLGKQLSIYLDNGLILLVHLKMTGQLIMGNHMFGHPTKTISSKSTRLIFTFSNPSKLFFNDQRKFGWIKVLSKSELAVAQKNLGYDIFSPKFTAQHLYSQLQKSSRPIKLVLLDQHSMSGIGNIYANDALFLAKVHPQTISKKVTLKQAKNLYHSLIPYLLFFSIVSSFSSFLLFLLFLSFLFPPFSSAVYQTTSAFSRFLYPLPCNIFRTARLK